MLDKQQNNFYVGELFVSGPIYGVNHKKYELVKNGAIDLKIGMMPKYTDYDKKIECERVFTIFLEDNGKYYCLHNGETYTEDGEFDFCTKLTPLEDIFPIISFRYGRNLTIKQALYLYSLFFKKGIFLNQERLFNNTKNLDMDRLFVGNLRLYTGYNPENLMENPFQFSNLERKLMLYKSDASLISIEGANEEESNGYGTIKGVHEQEVFKTLFLKYSGKGMYNLHNFDFYDEVPSIWENCSPIETRCGDLIPLEQALDDQNIICQDKTISVPKALRLYRKLIKK